jgi:hypothetical protein
MGQTVDTEKVIAVEVTAGQWTPELHELFDILLGDELMQEGEK